MKIKIIKIENRLLPIISIVDKDNNTLQVALSIDILKKIIKQINTTKAGISYLEYIGISHN